MIRARKDGREIAAMILNDDVNGVVGIVQCLIPGCEAHLVIMVDDGDPKVVVAEFLEGHDCDPKRFSKLNRPFITRR